VRETRPGVLVGLGAGAALLVVGLVALLRPTLPAVPWTLPATLAVVTAGILAAALSFRRRLRAAPGAKPYDPLQAARMVVLAKACSHGGALVAGGYGGLAVALVMSSASPLRRLDAALSGLTALAALALVGVGLLLERFCRIPPADEPPDAAGRPPAPAA
jgi:Protein of unknown function (DUF3180)